MICRNRIPNRLILSAFALLIAGPVLTGAVLSPNTHAQTGCLSDSEVSEAIKKLALPLSLKERVSVINNFRATANRSAKCRTRVVHQLMTAMDNPNPDTQVDQRTYNT